MLKKQYIFIFLIFLLLIILESVTFGYVLYQKSTEDPVIGLLESIQRQRHQNEIDIKAWLEHKKGTLEWEQLGKTFENTHSSFQVFNDESIFRSKFYEGENICDTLKLKTQRFIHCVQIFDRNNRLNPHLKSIGKLTNEYLWSDSNPAFSFYLKNRTYGLKANVASNPSSFQIEKLWFLIPYFSLLLLLLIVPFNQSIFSKDWWIFPFLISIILGNTFLSKTLFPVDESTFDINSFPYLSIVIIVGFAVLYFWKKQHLIQWKNSKIQFAFHWLLLVLLFSFGLTILQFRNFDLQLTQAFIGIERMAISDLRIIIIGIILFGAHLISLHQHWQSLRFNVKVKNKRIGLFVILAILHFIIGYFLVTNCPVIPFVLVLSIYFLLIDLFSDGRQNSSIWTILWIVILSIMISGLMFYDGFWKSVAKTANLLEKDVPSSVVFQLGSSYNQNYTLDEYYKEDKWNRISPKSSYLIDEGVVHIFSEKGNAKTLLKIKIPGIIKAASLFSLVFILNAALYFLILLIQRKIKLMPRTLRNHVHFQSSFSRRIQISFLLFTITSFFIIAFTTILLLNNQYNQNRQNLLKVKLAGIQDQIFQLDYSENDKSKILRGLNSITERNKIYVVIYDNDGISLTNNTDFLSTSMQEYLTKYPENSRSEELENGAFISYINTENDKFPFAKISGLILDEGPIMSIYDFVSGILNVYVFLFIIAVTIALFIAKSVVDPLSNLSLKMKKLKLGKDNQMIEWSGTDEVGVLINNYNEMVQKLEESAIILAHTERDMAWREMARQVAHEIKNPLTPMKLSIQHLQRQYEMGIIPDKEKIDRISATLLEQINNLTNIADAFSNVAKLPTASNEKIILNEVVESVHDLFRKREDMDINLSEPIDDLFVFADKNHLVRILNNILKNAIEAIPTEKRGKIEIKLYKKNGDAIIQVSDNGAGIPKQMESKIFTPKFTTKSSGSGLGLAIAANMIESFNGNISFKTQENVGTSFFISIPLMRLDQNLGENRVLLD